MWLFRTLKVIFFVWLTFSIAAWLDKKDTKKGKAFAKECAEKNRLEQEKRYKADLEMFPYDSFWQNKNPFKES